MKRQAVYFVLASLLLIFLLNETTEASQSESRSAGGKQVKNIPEWAAIIYYKKGGSAAKRFTCSGTLIAPNVVITADHCLDGQLTVSLGENMGQGEEIDVIQTIYPPSKSNEKMYRDIGLLVLEKDSTNDYLKVVSPQAKLKTGSFVEKFGYGDDTQGRFGRFENYNVLYQSPKICGLWRMTAAEYKTYSACYGGYKGQTACPGDSGGPGLTRINGERTLFSVSSKGYGWSSNRCSFNGQTQDSVLNQPIIANWIREVVIRESGINPIKTGLVDKSTEVKNFCTAPFVRGGLTTKEVVTAFKGTNCLPRFVNRKIKMKKYLPDKDTGYSKSIKVCRTKKKVSAGNTIAAFEFKFTYIPTGQIFAPKHRLKVLMGNC